MVLKKDFMKKQLFTTFLTSMIFTIHPLKLPKLPSLSSPSTSSTSSSDIDFAQKVLDYNQKVKNFANSYKDPLVEIGEVALFSQPHKNTNFLLVEEARRLHNIAHEKMETAQLKWNTIKKTYQEYVEKLQKQYDAGQISDNKLKEELAKANQHLKEGLIVEDNLQFYTSVYNDLKNVDHSTDMRKALVSISKK
jgi:hypothetical protein